MSTRPSPTVRPDDAPEAGWPTPAGEQTAPEPSGPWDWSTLGMTAVAGLTVVGMITLQLTGHPLAALLVGLVAGAAIGVLAGYRPLHEMDSALLDGPRRGA